VDGCVAAALLLRARDEKLAERPEESFSMMLEERRVMAKPDPKTPISSAECAEDILYEPGQQPVTVPTGRSHRFQACWRIASLTIGGVTERSEKPMNYRTGPRAPSKT
jgi:hypothetical protein